MEHMARQEVQERVAKVDRDASATRSTRPASSSRRRRFGEVRRDASTSRSAWASIPKHADQMVRGAVVLPHGTGKSQRVVVIAKGDKANEAQDAGADAVGAEDLVEKIQKENWPSSTRWSRRRT